MTAFADGRYQLVGSSTRELAECQDTNLDRKVSIHWVAGVAMKEAVRSRVAQLQSVRSRYVALIYDMVEHAGRIGVVEEQLDGALTVAKGDRLRRIYELCSGLSALHERGLAHGRIAAQAFRADPEGHGRICSLEYAREGLGDPALDCLPLAALLGAMGVDRIADPELAALVTRLGSADPPRISELCGRLAALLLRDKHRALAYWRGTNSELSAKQRAIKFTHPKPGIASISINYDGTRFYIEATGEVRINNASLPNGSTLPGSCVIALGGSHRPWHDRYFITFDQSHPEVA